MSLSPSISRTMWIIVFSLIYRMERAVEIRVLNDKEAFRRRRNEEWRKSCEFWLSGPLRHVTDVGDYICDRVQDIFSTISSRKPMLVDMGCGSAWLLSSLLSRGGSLKYCGLDSSKTFVEHGRAKFAGLEDIDFEQVDLEIPIKKLPQCRKADLVVNAFNFFELCDLRQGFRNARNLVRPGGRLLVSTIDKTYLLLAISSGWEDFLLKLKLYSELPGTKYAFQPIDLGNAVSGKHYYPSVFYTTQDYVDAAKLAGFKLETYTEKCFTEKLVPKIYIHLEFVSSCGG